MKNNIKRMKKTIITCPICKHRDNLIERTYVNHDNDKLNYVCSNCNFYYHSDQKLFSYDTIYFAEKLHEKYPNVDNRNTIVDEIIDFYFNKFLEYKKQIRFRRLNYTTKSIINEALTNVNDLTRLIEDIHSIIRDENKVILLASKGIIDSYQHDKNEKRINNIIGEYE